MLLVLLSSLSYVGHVRDQQPALLLRYDHGGPGHDLPLQGGPGVPCTDGNINTKTTATTANHSNNDATTPDDNTNNNKIMYMWISLYFSPTISLNNPFNLKTPGGPGWTRA